MVLYKDFVWLTRLESSTSCRMCGLTRWINSQMYLLHGTGPFGSIITFVPSSAGQLSYLIFLAAGDSVLLLTIIGSGTGTFRSVCTSLNSLLRNNGVSSSSFSLTIFSGKPLSTSCSAFDFRESLYSCTCEQLNYLTSVYNCKFVSKCLPFLSWRLPSFYLLALGKYFIKKIYN